MEPLPTLAEISILELTVKEAAPVLPNLTAVASMKLVPVIMTSEPEGAEVGVKEVITGGELWIKVLVLATVPPGVVMLITPVVPVPTTAMILVLEILYEAAGMSPNKTEVAPVKFLPVIMTVVPGRPEAGLKEVMVGGGMKV